MMMDFLGVDYGVGEIREVTGAQLIVGDIPLVKTLVQQ